jgi:hypothetical protein
MDRLCCLVVRVTGYRSRDLGFDSQIFCEIAGLERRPLSLLKITEELYGKVAALGLETRD